MTGAVMDEAMITSADLTSVLEELERLREQLQLITAGQLCLIGVLLGVIIIIVLAVMFR